MAAKKEQEDKLRALLVRALTSPDEAGALADHCRYNLDMNYNQTFELVREVHPKVELPEWDQLLADSEPPL